MNHRRSPICKYSPGERHLGGNIAHAKSGSFTTDVALFKPSDILEVGFFFCFLWLSTEESSWAFKMQTQSWEREVVFIKSTWAQVAYLFVEAILSWVVYIHCRFCKGLSAAKEGYCCYWLKYYSWVKYISLSAVRHWEGRTKWETHWGHMNMWY